MFVRNATIIAACSGLLACASTPAAPQHASSTAACERLGDTDMALAAVYEPGNVTNAKKLQERVFRARAIQPLQTVGAELHVPAQPALTQQYMERVLTCHAAAGRAAHPNDPLVPEHGRVASVTVRSMGDGFAVRILGEDPASGREIWRRAEAFTQPADAVTVEQVASASFRPSLDL
jgi:hypothetical protein